MLWPLLRDGANIMGKPIPVWLFLLCLLSGSLFALLFGWSVKTTMGGDTRLGMIGEASIAAASLPNLVTDTFNAIREDEDEVLRIERPNDNFAGFQPVRAKAGIRLQGLLVRADEAALERAPGWRILVGSFVIDGQLQNAALAFAPRLELVKVLILREEEIHGKKPPPAGRDLVYGFAILKDGSMIFTFDLGISLQRIDRCGRRLWSTAGEFNHAVSLEPDEKHFWTLDGDLKGVEIVRAVSATGQVVRRIRVSDIIAANPTIDILEIGKVANYGPGTIERWTSDDPFHFNDVEPLPATIADRFPAFKAGDLLLSARTLNLVFVLNPDTLKVKWWAIGAWRRQHDPDWQPTGEITVLDNRPGRGYSRIVSIDPTSNSTRVLFDGRVNDFYTPFMGKHQITKYGNILITSSRQGRVFEVEPDGRVVFDMVNEKPGSDRFNYLLSDAIWLPLEGFDFSKDLSCEK